ncbi:hypothetical protein HAZT_HAZT001255 [Hyalella azteca]|uniref:Abhydrolase domain containing 18 n=1 Tax=Hyalella azteca TaxID=294128 RepID=A0A6A0GQ30_HYAAZ|nr:hypothetical protein HAZT_HAZT001255 [Hyalella azteca]
MADKNLCYSLVDPLTPVTISKKQIRRSYVLYEGHFMSPFDLHLPGLLPEASRKAHFQMILPHKWAKDDYRPVCIQLAGTGDHGFWKRRTWMAKPLVRDYGIGSILLENPFYGLRKPPEQRRSSLLNVSDLFVMGGCLIFESMVLLHWCLRQRLGPVGLTGISMGGHMASLACCSWPRPIPLVPCLSWTTASGVFTQVNYRDNKLKRSNVLISFSMEKIFILRNNVSIKLLF